ncbi:protein-tyrosine phosphatase-like protein [Crucibulum laeve]|uniref:Protein-tyrosine phosphatase-like protein n=1 Tax=Crucibulum laeve TaxID=68775 RepID=A0A5C3MD61_9AGAR|nr:protein-tyrosine phosphatase-like protein [Crucibulum laeve]
MDAIRVSKVERVACTKSGATSVGTVHLTAHHLIFRYDGGKEKEMWVPYPLVSLVNRLPQTLQGDSPLTFHTRTFETFTLTFGKDSEASDVFESVKELTVATSVTQLYAFFYTPNPPFPNKDGWILYSPREEFGRMGVGSRSKAWRFTDINKDYSFCPTYPARLVVPTKISDATLQYASKYRSKCRIPILSYLHWANYGSITRSSQPMVGITQNRSIQDEKLIEAIFQSHWSPETRTSNAPVYGATCTNLIIDARPTTNAVANTAKGAGTENMDNYKEGKKAYLGIDNIHIMRDSLAKIVEALREADTLSVSVNSDGSEGTVAVLDRQALRRSGWLRHISAILEGTLLITRNIHVNSSHVLIHCSDGWDRTAQLSSLSQLCLDPFYRTIKGFQILVEKDWLSFGHRFLDRCGHLSSEKFFVSPSENAGSNSGADAAQAFLASVQHRFASQHHIKETSPVFHQFLESVRQIQRQYPERFEFNERFLKQLYFHLYSCQFGTFMFNCERERRVGEGGGPAPWEQTVSVWDFFNSPSEMEQNLNPLYNSSLDDPTSRAPKADMGVLFPNPKDVRFWNELYGRTDEEMNGRTATSPSPVGGTELVGPMEGSLDDPAMQSFGTPSLTSSLSSPSRSPALRPSSVKPTSSRSASPAAPPRDLSASMPEVARPSPARQDSFSPFASTSSAFSLRTANPSSPSSSSQSSPIWARNKPPDFTGVKSVWGKLSSNASAAFSVVQDAYAGVAKDLRNTGGVEDDTPEKTAELRGRDTLSAWGEDRSSGTSKVNSSLSGLTIGNPWATTSSHPPTLLEENPWGPSSISSQTYAHSSDSSPPLDSSLPLDPTVATPISVSRRNTPSSTTLLAGEQPHPQSSRSPASQPSAKVPATPPTKSTDDIDPLGVGLL